MYYSWTVLVTFVRVPDQIAFHSINGLLFHVFILNVFITLICINLHTILHSQNNLHQSAHNTTLLKQSASICTQYYTPKTIHSNSVNTQSVAGALDGYGATVLTESKLIPGRAT